MSDKNDQTDGSRRSPSACCVLFNEWLRSLPAHDTSIYAALESAFKSGYRSRQTPIECLMREAIQLNPEGEEQYRMWADSSHNAGNRSLADKVDALTRELAQSKDNNS